MHVLACVGPHSEENFSELLFQIIDENRSLLDSILQLTRVPSVDDTRNWLLPNPIPKSSWVALQCLLAVNFRDRRNLIDTFTAFMRRQYFSRVWILQEFHLAPSISICCGMDIRPLDDILAVSMLVDFWTNIAEYKRSLTNITLFATHMLSWKAWLLRREDFYVTVDLKKNLRAVQSQRGCLTLASGIGGRRRLAAVLDAMQNFQCTDVRDRLFGVLALVEWGHGTPPVPDYGKDSYEVAIEVLRLYITDPEHQPVSGMAVEWPRRLLQIFDINVENLVIQKAMIKRYNSQSIPREILAAYRRINPVRIRTIIDYPGRRQIYNLNVSKKPPHFGGHLRDVWHGVKLSVAGDQVSTNSPGPPRYYLSCREDLLRYSPSFDQSFVNIMDQDDRSFAFAPNGTMLGDWLLVSEKGSLSDIDPEMVIVRQTKDISTVYQIIGPAIKDRGHQDVILPLLRWEYFRSSWNAEDLFLFDWTYLSCSANAQTTGPATDWLQMKINAHIYSSFFYGPTGVKNDGDTDSISSELTITPMRVRSKSLEDQTHASCCSCQKFFDIS